MFENVITVVLYRKNMSIWKWTDSLLQIKESERGWATTVSAVCCSFLHSDSKIETDQQMVTCIKKTNSKLFIFKKHLHASYTLTTTS